MNFKEINIGQLIQTKVLENETDVYRICKFMKCTEDDLNKMYNSNKLDTETLLRWSKLLEYDFFRIYSQHLILYAPQENNSYNNITAKEASKLPHFRKNIYTKEIISFILEMIENKEKTRFQIIEEYRIPKSTLYKWMNKYIT